MTAGPTQVPTTMRVAFIDADIGSASPAICRMVIGPLKRGAGLIRRRQMWNKGFSDSPRPKNLRRSK